jgi:hypothetical protein
VAPVQRFVGWHVKAKPNNAQNSPQQREHDSGRQRNRKKRVADDVNSPSDQRQMKNDASAEKLPGWQCVGAAEHAKQQIENWKKNKTPV